MFPLKIALAGRQNNKFFIKAILDAISATIAADFDSVDELFKFQGELPFCMLLCEIGSPEDLTQLERIVDRYPGYPVMAILERSLDSNSLVRAMRAGAAQVVQTPLDEDDFSNALNRIAVQYGFPPNPCRSIAVLGSKAGSGASTLSINLAHQITNNSPNWKTTLVEANPTFGSIAMRLGLQPTTTIHDLIRHPESLNTNAVNSACISVTSNMKVLLGPRDRIQTQPTVLSMLQRVIGYTCQFSDTVIVDMPYEYSPVYRNILEDVSDILIVGEQSVSSIHNMQVITNMLVENQIPAIRHYVINKHNRKLKSFNIEAIQKLLNVNSLFVVQEDHKLVSEAEDNGQLITTPARSSGLVADFCSLAQHLRPRESPSESDGARWLENPTAALKTALQPFLTEQS